MGECDEVDIGHVYRSLKNSDTRNEVFSFACAECSEEKKWFSVIQIAKATGYSERAVMGALLGYGKRYKVEDALVSLGLMEYKKLDLYGYAIDIFSITEHGLNICKDKKLNNYSNNLKYPLDIKIVEIRKNTEEKNSRKPPRASIITLYTVPKWLYAILFLS
jgi:predicted transcriptional regulator with HTH domain